MNSFAVSSNDGQAPARRFGGFAGCVVILCACLSATALWAVFAADSMGILKTSIHLQSNGETAMGTITRLEKHSGSKPGSGPTYTLIVEFDVDGKTYVVKSYAAYGALATYEVGDSIRVIYDPADPETAQVDIFMERWLDPLLSTLPF